MRVTKLMISANSNKRDVEIWEHEALSIMRKNPTWFDPSLVKSIEQMCPAASTCPSAERRFFNFCWFIRTEKLWRDAEVDNRRSLIGVIK